MIWLLIIISVLLWASILLIEWRIRILQREVELLQAQITELLRRKVDLSLRADASPFKAALKSAFDAMEAHHQPKSGDPDGE